MRHGSHVTWPRPGESGPDWWPVWPVVSALWAVSRGFCNFRPQWLRQWPDSLTRPIGDDVPSTGHWAVSTLLSLNKFWVTESLVTIRLAATSPGPACTAWCLATRYLNTAQYLRISPCHTPLTPCQPRGLSRDNTPGVTQPIASVTRLGVMLWRGLCLCTGHCVCSWGLSVTAVVTTRALVSWSQPTGRCCWALAACSGLARPWRPSPSCRKLLTSAGPGPGPPPTLGTHTWSQPAGPRNNNTGQLQSAAEVSMSLANSTQRAHWAARNSGEQSGAWLIIGPVTGEEN